MNPRVRRHAFMRCGSIRTGSLRAGPMHRRSLPLAFGLSVLGVCMLVCCPIHVAAQATEASAAAGSETPSDTADTAATAATSNPSVSDTQRTEARRHITAANTLMEQELWQQALLEYQRVYDILVDHPQQHYMLFNIGRCHERLQHYAEAIRHYRRYLDEGGGGEEDAQEVRDAVARLQTFVGTIRVQTNIEEGEVWVDGQHVTDLDHGRASWQTEAGTHRVEIHAEGYPTAREELNLNAQSDARVELTLEIVDRSNTGLLATIVTGSVLTVGGAIVLGIGIQNFSDVRRVGLSDRTAVYDRQKDEESQLMMIAGSIIAGVGLVSGLVGITLLALQDGEEATDAEAYLRLTPTGLRLEGTF